MAGQCALTAGVLNIDAAAVSREIESAIREQVLDRLKRKGTVLGLSGGIDSSVSAALCVGALGKDRVFGLFMPEADSSTDSVRLGRLLAQGLGIRAQVEDINPILRSAGCYRRRDEAIRAVVPEFGERHKYKIVLANVPDGPASVTYSVVVQSPTGVTTRARLTAEAYLGVVAATNFKQRTRKMIEYYYADRF